MKKLLSLMTILFALSACGANKADLKGNSYQLQNEENKGVIILAFDKEEMRYYGVVVNRYFGSYEVDGHKIKFGPAGATMMMGPQAEMETEQKFLQTLPQISEYKLDGDDLTLITKDGQELKFFKITKVEE